MKQPLLIGWTASARCPTLQPSGSKIARVLRSIRISLSNGISTLVGLLLFAGLLAHETPSVAATSKGAQATSSQRDLSRVLRFRDSANCDYAEPLGSIFTDLALSWETARTSKVKPIAVRGYSQAMVPSFRKTKEGAIKSMLPISGSWYGLHVKGLVVVGHEDSDYLVDYIQFSESATYVRKILNRHGFNLPLPGKSRKTKLSGGIWIDVIDGDTTLACEEGEMF